MCKIADALEVTLNDFREENPICQNCGHLKTTQLRIQTMNEELKTGFWVERGEVPIDCFYKNSLISKDR